MGFDLSDLYHALVQRRVLEKIFAGILRNSWLIEMTMLLGDSAQGLSQILLS